MGGRVFSSFRVWAAALIWTWAYSEGAGFGAFFYRCASGYRYDCNHHLALNPLFPPGVSIWAFLWNVIHLSFPGFYDSGLTVGFFIVVVVLLVGSRLPADALDTPFYWPGVVFAAIVFCLSGFAYEVHVTLSLGSPHVLDL